jgi:hypothetical protein
VAQLQNRNASPAGAEHPAPLNQRGALRAVGKKGSLVPPGVPGPLVDQDGDAPISTAVRTPLVAAPMPLNAKPGAAADASKLPARMAVLTPEMVEAVRRQCVDLKAFTGKGDPQVVRLAVKAVDDIHDEMAKLAQVSALWGKRVLYLTHHVRGATQQHSLRWRGYTVAQGRGAHKHLSWDEAADRIRAQPYEVKIKFHALDLEARRLNEAEQAARADLKRLRALNQDPDR